MITVEWIWIFIGFAAGAMAGVIVTACASAGEAKKHEKDEGAWWDE